MSSETLHCFTYVHLIIILSILHFSLATDTISPTQPLNDGQTLTSSLQSFELGFFSPGNSKNRYLGIWYKNIPNTVVWIANRNNPINDSSGVLAIGADGNLVLLNQNKSIIWSSSVSGVAENSVAQILDTGNFVIRKNISTSSESYMWQSFDYPSDTQLPGMKLGWDLRRGLNRFLTSWKSGDDPSSGDFTYKLDIEGAPQLVIYKGSKKSSRMGPWNGMYFGSIPMVSYMLFNSTMVFDDVEKYYMYVPVSNAVIMRLSLNESGVLNCLVWSDPTTGWTSLYSMPYDSCGKYGFCGANSICSANTKPICQCLTGFVPKSQKEWMMQNWTSGCVRSTPVGCQKDEGFVRLQGVTLPDLYMFQVHRNMSLTECEAECLKNCSCKGYYANSDARGVPYGCLMWFDDLVDIVLVSAEYRGQDMYIRSSVSNMESSSNSSKKRRRTILLAVSITVGTIFFSLTLCYIIWKNKAKTRGQECTNNKDIELPQFDLDTIAVATNNFSFTNIIGKGGFGPVYKGNLPSGEEIAVKRLSKDSGQGAEQFMNEVDLIVKLQHRNLVALLGCCIQGDEKMLIYEYMPNKSLDYFIFDRQRSALLKWQKRFDIILGIARGLLYLHQDSKLQIIHRDLKTSNILLDSGLNPKISDFGLARILGGDEKEATTKRVVGTYGYMSPEYAIDGTISAKSDVFSFGVILLEVVTGKKNRGFCDTDHQHNLLGHAWLQWSEGKAQELIDKSLKDSFVTSQLLRCIQVGLLCVQNFAEDRPPMSSVVFMLANDDAMLPQPKQPGFFRERSSGSEVTETSIKQETYSENTVTISILDGR